MLKYENKKIKHHTKFPSVGGVPRSGGVVRECKNVLPTYSPLPSWGAGPPRSLVILGLDPRIQVVWHFIIPVIASETKQSSKLCTHANACDFIIHWIATVTAFPRDDKRDVPLSL